MSATFTTEFRHEFEIERARLLRKRFLWYSGVVSGFSVLTVLGVGVATLARNEQADALASFLGFFISAGLTLLYIWAFIHAYRRVMDREGTLRLVYWLIVINGVVSLVTTPILVTMQVNHQAEIVSARAAEKQTAPPTDDTAASEGDETPHTADPDRDDSVRVRSGGLNLQLDEKGRWLSDPRKREEMVARAVVLNNAFVSIFFSHFLACLFLPWTPRESMRPITPLLVLNAVIALWYIRLFTLGVILSCLLSPLVAAPGLLICWWRHSRHRERFNIRMLKGRYGELKQELASARQIHESLFPRPISTGPVRFEYRYEPMRQIGGDYLFARSRGGHDGRLPILDMAIVDVTGHGIGAALTVNRLYGEIERQLGENPDAGPGDILTGLNDYLHHTLATHSVYATAVCLRFDPNDGTLRWASAGHPPAFLRTVDGRIERLDSTTLVLGACRGDDFDPHEQETRFLPGDMLVIYTDGALEARNDQGRMLGLRGLEALIAGVRPDEEGGYASAVLRGVDEHRFGPPQDDTLIVEVWRPIEVASASGYSRMSRSAQ